MRTHAILGCALILAGCAARTPAPVDDRRPQPLPTRPPVAKPVPAAPATVPPGHYVVRRGDTLYSIALEYGQDYRDLQRWNAIDDPTRLRVGQVLRVVPPEGEAPVQVGAARKAAEAEARPLETAPQARPGAAEQAPTKTEPKALRLPYTEQNLALLHKLDAAARATPGQGPGAEAPKPQAAKPEAAKPEPTRAADRDPEAIEFIWPVRGRVIATFSEPTNKGVDIAGRLGDPVVAAAPGRVVYTGTGIRGYGKLIVIRHENGWNSVYAHNREILVKEGQTVARGQKIAELGDTDADQPKLHFEIRRHGRPVDPLRHLPPPQPG